MLKSSKVKFIFDVPQQIPLQKPQPLFIFLMKETPRISTYIPHDLYPHWEIHFIFHSQINENHQLLITKTIKKQQEQQQQQQRSSIYNRHKDKANKKGFSESCEIQMENHKML